MNIKFIKYINEALILATIPVAVYSIKFIYDSGYGSFFKIPPSLVSFTIADVLPVISILIVTSLILFSQVFGSWDFKKRNTGQRQIVIDNIFLLLFFSAALWIFTSDLRVLRYAFIVLALYAIFRHLLLPLAIHRKEKGYFNKVDKHLEKAAKSRETYYDYIYGFALLRITKLFIIICGSSMLIFSYGYSSAKNQEYYYTSHSTSDWVVVRFMNDKVVMVDVLDKKIGKKLQVKEITEGNLSLKRERVGPLKIGEK